MFSLIKKVPYWYLIAIPLLCVGLGILSNQIVLWVNFDKFPVMYNNEKIHQSCQTPDPSETDLISILIGHKAPAATKPADVVNSIPAKDSDLCQNGGKFLDDTHVIMSRDSKLKWLSDVWDLNDATYSIGDLAIMSGEWILRWAQFAWLVLVLRKLVEG
jgi:hypothetical protein